MREVLEQAIVDRPDDVQAHAVYADWLSDQGDPRGAFISMQLALEDPSKTLQERQALLQQEKALLEAHQGRWLGPLQPMAYALGLEFERGFLRSLRVKELDAATVRALARCNERRFLRALSIESLAYDFEASLAPLLEGAVFESLRTVRLGEELDVDVLLERDYGPSCHCYFVQALELLERMPRLEEAHLLCKSYDLERLFSSQKLGSLRVLRIYHHNASNRQEVYPLSVLADNPSFRNLEELRFHPHHLEGDGSFLPLDQVTALLRSEHLQQLTRLQLRLSDMGDAGCQALVDSGILERLWELDLRHGCITDAGARILAADPATRRLEHLDLRKNALTAEGSRLMEALGPAVLADRQLTPEAIADMEHLRAGDFE